MANTHDQSEHARPEMAGRTHGTSTMASRPKEKASDMASEAGTRLTKAWEGAKHGVQEAATSVGETTQHAWEGIQSGASTAASTAQDLIGDVSGFVRRYPLACLGAAFALGCLSTLACSALSPNDNVARRMSRASA